jgi:ankyrin repeat protein
MTGARIHWGYQPLLNHSLLVTLLVLAGCVPLNTHSSANRVLPINTQSQNSPLVDAPPVTPPLPRVDGYTAMTAANQAVGMNDVSRLRRALDAGADPNAAADNGLTLLMRASRCGSTDCVKLLVARGADVNAQDNNGLSAVMLAGQTSETSGVQIIHYLCERGADVNAHTNKGETALHIAKSLRYEKLVAVLRHYGAK